MALYILRYIYFLFHDVASLMHSSPQLFIHHLSIHLSRFFLLCMWLWPWAATRSVSLLDLLSLEGDSELLSLSRALSRALSLALAQATRSVQTATRASWSVSVGTNTISPMCPNAWTAGVYGEGGTCVFCVCLCILCVLVLGVCLCSHLID